MKRRMKRGSTGADRGDKQHHDASRIIESWTTSGEDTNHERHKLRVKSSWKKTNSYCSRSSTIPLFVLFVCLLAILVVMNVLKDTPLSSTIPRRFSHRMVSLLKMESKPAWPTPIIHIVNTRFMQHQGNLTTLATARLHLFRTVCLPSMLHQKNQNFLWIIKVDPFLDSQIKNDLLITIHNEIDLFDKVNVTEMNGKTFSSLRERIFVIGSNTNFLTGHNEGAWRGGKESQEILSHLPAADLSKPRNLSNFTYFLRRTNKQFAPTTQSGIWSGNIELLQRAKESEPHKIILETRLDADDGLHTNYIEYVQNDALRKFGFFPVSSDTFDSRKLHEPHNYSQKYKWYYWCAGSHLKWYLHAKGERGQLDGEKRSNFCITPGLTVGFNVGIHVEDVPQYGHHELYKKLHHGNHTTCLESANVFEEKEEYYAVCLGFVNGFIAAVRSRTETSAGMADIRMVKRTTNSRTIRQEEDEDFLWNVLWKSFGLLNDSFIETKTYFEQNRKQIAKENLEGQCRGDHSCKISSRIQLNQIIKGSSQG